MNNEETTVFISDADQYVFGQGTHYEIYKKLGAHFCRKERRKACSLQCGRQMQKMCM